MITLEDIIAVDKPEVNNGINWYVSGVLFRLRFRRVIDFIAGNAFDISNDVFRGIVDYIFKHQGQGRCYTNIDCMIKHISTWCWFSSAIIRLMFRCYKYDVLPMGRYDYSVFLNALSTDRLKIMIEEGIDLNHKIQVKLPITHYNTAHQHRKETHFLIDCPLYVWFSKSTKHLELMLPFIGDEISKLKLVDHNGDRLDIIVLWALFADEDIYETRDFMDREDKQPFYSFEVLKMYFNYGYIPHIDSKHKEWYYIEEDVAEIYLNNGINYQTLYDYTDIALSRKVQSLRSFVKNRIIQSGGDPSMLKVEWTQMYPWRT